MAGGRRCQPSGQLSSRGIDRHRQHWRFRAEVQGTNQGSAGQSWSLTSGEFSRSSSPPKIVWEITSSDPSFSPLDVSNNHVTIDLGGKCKNRFVEGIPRNGIIHHQGDLATGSAKQGHDRLFVYFIVKRKFDHESIEFDEGTLISMLDSYRIDRGINNTKCPEKRQETILNVFL